MLPQKILIVGSYPVVNPIHGGQKRTTALINFYKTKFKDVKYVAVFHRGLYKEKGYDDLWLGDSEIIKGMSTRPLEVELIQGYAIDKDIHVRSYMAETLKSYKPDIIQIEQGYPYLGLSVLLKELNLKPSIIYSCHNIEYKMKEGILAKQNVGKRNYTSVVKKIKEMEKNLCLDSDLIITVTSDDAKCLRMMGAKKCIVVPNGINPIDAKTADTGYWEKLKKQSGIDKMVSFIASGHPPNWEGFINAIGTNTSFLKKDTKIVLVGGVSDYFKTKFKPDHKKFWQSVIPVGVISQRKLEGLILTTDILILPIVSGGGSNLKTAEAIISGKKVVATSFAFRGFEAYKSLPNIYIADTQALFKESILKALTSPYVNRNSDQVKLANSVSWSSCLKALNISLLKLSIILCFRNANKYITRTLPNLLIRRNR